MQCKRDLKRASYRVKMKAFIVKHYKLSMLLLVFVLLFSIALTIGGDVVAVSGICSIASIAGLLGMVIYKTGKIPLIMSDRGKFSAMKEEYGEEEADKLYKKQGLDMASSMYWIMVVTFPLSIVAEVVYLIA